MKTKQLKNETSQTSGVSINVRVGYAWQKFPDDGIDGANVLHDTFWQSLKKLFKPTCAGLEKRRNVRVDFGRLRASHGRLVWPSIEKRIENADVLLFDVAEAPLKHIPAKGVVEFPKVLESLNGNVLLEIGYALGRGKRVMLMCPKHLFELIPSDLKGFLWTVYKGYFKNGEMVRVFADSHGAIPAFRSILSDALTDKETNSSDD